LNLYKDKINKYDKYIAEMKDVLKKKQAIIETKKLMNFSLVELCKIKKTEVSCLETVVKSSLMSSTLKDSLVKIKSTEEDLLKK